MIRSVAIACLLFGLLRTTASLECYQLGRTNVLDVHAKTRSAKQTCPGTANQCYKFVCMGQNSTRMAVPPVTRLPPVKQVPVTTKITSPAAARKPAPPPTKPRGNRAPARRRPNPPPAYYVQKGCLDPSLPQVSCQTMTDQCRATGSTGMCYTCNKNKCNGSPTVAANLILACAAAFLAKFFA